MAPTWAVRGLFLVHLVYCCVGAPVDEQAVRGVWQSGGRLRPARTTGGPGDFQRETQEGLRCQGTVTTWHFFTHYLHSHTVQAHTSLLNRTGISLTGNDNLSRFVSSLVRRASLIMTLSSRRRRIGQ